jgi:Asp-tRNA(Asn)/Glu-tRNA(Gln) amidotransferase A subunit family amidase
MHAAPFPVMETSIDQIHAAFEAHTLTAHQLVQMYLDRIAAYDQQGPHINSVITVNASGRFRRRQTEEGRSDHSRQNHSERVRQRRYL